MCTLCYCCHNPLTSVCKFHIYIYIYPYAPLLGALLSLIASLASLQPPSPSLQPPSFTIPYTCIPTYCMRKYIATTYLTYLILNKSKLYNKQEPMHPLTQDLDTLTRNKPTYCKVGNVPYSLPSMRPTGLYSRQQQITNVSISFLFGIACCQVYVCSLSIIKEWTS